jgi:hypothetical protein
VRSGNVTGVIGGLLLLLAAVANASVAAEAAGAILGWIAIGLFIFAGFKGSRWWFGAPAILIMLYIWALTQGH